MRGRINTQEETIKFLLKRYLTFSQRGYKSSLSKSTGMGDTERIDVIEVQQLPRKYSVYLFFSREKKLILTDKKYWVNWDES